MIPRMIAMPSSNPSSFFIFTCSSLGSSFPATGSMLPYLLLDLFSPGFPTEGSIIASLHLKVTPNYYSTELKNTIHSGKENCQVTIAIYCQSDKEKADNIISNRQDRPCASHVYSEVDREQARSIPSYNAINHTGLHL